MATRKLVRILIEAFVVVAGLIVGAIGGRWFRGPAMGIDETILFVYVAPGAAAGVFVAMAGVLYFRRKLSFLVLLGALLGAAAGIGSSALFWKYVLEPAQFEPPGGDIVFMLGYFGLFSLTGLVIGAVVGHRAGQAVRSAPARRS